MRCPNVHQSIPRSLRYHENRCNRFCSCSLHNRCNFCFLGGGGRGWAKASAKRTRSVRHARRGKRLLARFALAVARLTKAKKKNNARCAGYHSWTKIKCGILEKKKKTKQSPQARREGRVLNEMKRLFNKLIVVFVESMRLLVRLPILIIKI